MEPFNVTTETTHHRLTAVVIREENSGRRWRSNRAFGSEMSATRFAIEQVVPALQKGAHPGTSTKWTEIEPVHQSPAWYLQQRAG